jgi:hypothetical protein
MMAAQAARPAQTESTAAEFTATDGSERDVKSLLTPFLQFQRVAT